jgi:hypothetical protein
MAYNRRDLIGHWIRRTQPEQKMCGHACCRGYRVHPKNMPVILPNPLLRRASDEDLSDHYQKVSRGSSDDDVVAQNQILAEMDRRDRKESARQERARLAALRIAGIRAERESAVEAAYLEADRDTRGNLLNRAGIAQGVSERSLFTGSEARARRYASTELLNHWETHHRPSGSMWRGRDTRTQYHDPGSRRRGRRGVAA